MSQSPVFEWVCERLESVIGWNRLVARGTVRLALKNMGLDPRTVDKKEMLTALRTAIQRALETHRISDGTAVCQRLERELANTSVGAAAIDSPEAIFKRLGMT
jgi:hypothetical protein